MLDFTLGRGGDSGGRLFGHLVRPVISFCSKPVPRADHQGRQILVGLDFPDLEGRKAALGPGQN
eukprot:7820337-Pyramimonas_sp.AAC.1